MKQFIFIFLLSFLFFTSSVFANEHTTIQMTKDGFVPSVITIGEGETIVFINKDTNPHWPASNPHPTHDIYPAFDSKKEINPGEVWVFTPKSGEWRYHDHLFPHHRGTLVVKSKGRRVKSGEFSVLTNLVTSVGNFMRGIGDAFWNVFAVKQQNHLSVAVFKNLTQQEQYAALKKIATEQSPEAAWSFLQTAYENNFEATGVVHDLVHYVGILLYEKEGFSGIKNCTEVFAFGCYHGFLDMVFSKNLDKLPDAEKACRSIGHEENGPYASCIHGIGHGVASFYNARDLKSSLSACTLIKKGQEYCYDGVFMEFARNAPSDFYKAEDPLYPCDTLEQKYIFSCGRNQPQVMSGRFHYSFAQVASACLLSTSNEMKNACFDSLGFTTVYSSGGKAKNIVEQCQTIANQTYEGRCITAAAGELVFQNIHGWQESSPAVCASLSEDTKNECNARVDGIIKEYGRK